MASKIQSDVTLTLAATEAAALLGVARQTFWRWQREGVAPPPSIKHGRCVRWSRETLEKFARGAAALDR